MAITQDGNSFTWTGTVTLTNATDLTTGVATLMLTPAGGIGNLPVLAQGDPGLPPVFDNVTATGLSAGAQPTASLTLNSAGGPGVASHYNLSLGIPAGATGASGTLTISGATDLEGSSNGNGNAPGSSQDQYMIVWQNADTKWKIKSQLCGNTYNATTFTAASGNTSPVNLATLTIPAQPFNWVPRVSGMALPTGTVNTHVDLRVLLNNSSTGQQVGYGYGVTGAGSAGIPVYPVTLIQAFGGALSTNYGVISAGAAATFYFQANQTAFTVDSWSVPTAGAYFSVKVDPIPGTN